MISPRARRAIARHTLVCILLGGLLPWSGVTRAAMPVIITIDTETSSGCSETECIPEPLSGRVYGRQDGRYYGIPLMMDLLEKHGTRGTFFVNGYLDSAFPEQEVVEMVRSITTRGHDVQFHAHAEFRCFRRCERGDMACRHRCTEGAGKVAGTSFENQLEVLREGALNIERWSGHYPVAYRGGALRADANTLKALATLGIPIDSTLSGPHHPLASVLPVNRLGVYEGVLEVPLLAYGEKLPLSRRVRFLDQQSAILEEQKFLLAKAAEMGVGAVPLLMHSFSFCDPGVACPIDRNVKRFDALLGHITSHPDQFVVMTMDEFWEAYRANPTAYHRAPAADLPKVGYWLVLRRSLVRFDQGWMNVVFLAANVAALLGLFTIACWGIVRLRRRHLAGDYSRLLPVISRPIQTGLAVATALALVVVAAMLSAEVRNPQEAVRMRDSLLARAGSAKDFAWTPAKVPGTFLLNTGEVPESLARIAREVVTAKDGWDQGLQIARHLADVPNRDGPIQHSTEKTYEVMFSSGGGYCADFTQVFIGMAIPVNLPVREWGLAFDGFGGNGHAIVEVFDERRGKWLMIDPFNEFYPVDATTGEPMSVLEFRDRLLEPDPLASTRIVRISPKVPGFADDQKLIEYFRHGADQFYLWWGTNLYSYEQDPVVSVAGHISRTAEQASAILRGVHPRIVIYPTATNRDLIRAVDEERFRTLLYVDSLAVLSLFLLVQIILLLRRGRHG